MALADTARLISTLELEDKFSATAAKAEKALAGIDKSTAKTSSTFGKIGSEAKRGFGQAASNIKTMGVVAAGFIASQVAFGVKSLAELEEVKNQTDAVIKSTGAAAAVSAEQIREQAEALEALSTVDDKAIQAGQNLLLTFTNIRNEAGAGNDIFNQATETLLDLSVAMGTEPKAAAVQLGKALNDPIKGITALTRVGVTFTEKQKEQIEALVEAGDTMEAQKVILAELNKEFGGSAAAFGKGPGADMRRFGDAIEGAQQALATGFLPLMNKVSTLIQESLGDPQVQRNITAFGESLAGGIEGLIDVAMGLPWEQIGASAKLLGTGAKALLDAFLGLPPWVQTAVLTGWGLNKLTGGALGNIAGTLTKAAFGSIRGGTPATPVYTREVGLGGGGTPVAGAGRGIGGALLGGAAKIFGIAIAAEIGREIGLALVNPQVQPTVEFEQSQWEQFINNPEATRNADVIRHNLEAVDSGLDDLIGENREGRFLFSLLFGDQLAQLEEQEATLKALLAETELQTAQHRAPPGTAPTLAEGGGADTAVTATIDHLHDGIQRALARGDIHAARLLKQQVDLLRGLDDRSEKRNNQIVAGLGKTHAALSTANRKLDEGNARQRELATGIREARDRIGTGFAESNNQLRAINSKDFSPTVNVKTDVHTTVAVNDIIRVWEHTSTAAGSGFGPEAP